MRPEKLAHLLGGRTHPRVLRRGPREVTPYGEGDPVQVWIDCARKELFAGLVSVRGGPLAIGTLTASRQSGAGPFSRRREMWAPVSGAAGGAKGKAGTGASAEMSRVFFLPSTH